MNKDNRCKEEAGKINPEACHSCGLCVTACPEKAIKLTKFISQNG